MRLNLTDKRGFTLIEAFVATIVLALSLFIVGLAIYMEFPVINQNREKAIAALSAQEEIENIRGMSFDTILTLGSSFVSSGFAYLKNPAGTLTIDDPFGNANIRRVSVRVSWSSLTGGTMQRDLVTFVTRNGIDKQ
jgi:type II secretory pathway pseudopilin PulG